MKRAIPVLFLLTAALLLAALPASDSFSTGTALSASWTSQSGNWVVGSGVARNSDGGVEGLAYWNADAFNANQYAQVKLGTFTANSWYTGVTARSSGTGATSACYVFSTDGTTGSGHTSIGEFTAGSFTELVGCTTSWTAGDTARIEVETSGSNAVIRGYRNGSQVCTYTDTTTVKTSGSAGMYAWVNSGGASNGVLDDFAAGNIAAGGGGASKRRGFIIK